MKKVLLSAVGLLFSISASFGQYCTGGPTSTNYANIGSISLAGETSDISFTGTCPGIIGIEDQSAMAADLFIGETYSIDIDWNSCSGFYASAGTAWIDFDGSGTFDVGEEVATFTGTPPSGVTNYSFTVPSAAIAGNTVLRVMQQEGGTLPLDPCESFLWGSASDFTISLACATLPGDTYTVCTGSTVALSATSALGDINWYDGTSTLVHTGDNYTTPALTSSEVYTATIAYSAVTGTCVGESAPANYTINVSPVDAVLTAIDESCTGNADGSFALGTVTCGLAPFTYSVDGGAFGPIPTDLTPGTYSVVIEDANTDQSSPITVVIGSASTVIPPNAVAVNTTIEACSGTASIMAEVLPPALDLTYTLNMYDTWGDGWGFGNTVDVLVDGVAVLTNVGLASGSTGSLTFTVQTGSVVTTVWNGGGFSGGETSYDIEDENNTVIAGPVSQANITPYNVPAVTGFGVNWYDDAVMTTNVGTTNPLETVGTSVMPTATNGTYEFYATYTLGACESATPTLVTVNVTDINLTLTAIDESCAGNADGSFVIGTLECGTAPFTYSVDGGAFGPIPTDLTPGTYSVVVEDASLNQTSPITVVIGSASTVIPPNAVAVNTTIEACSGTASIMAEVLPPAFDLTYTLNMYDSFGDGWNGNTMNVLVDGVAVLTNVGLASGSTGSLTFTVQTGSVVTTNWNNDGSYGGETSYDIEDENNTVIAGPVSQANITPYNVPAATGYGVNWYDDAVMTTNVGTTNPLETVGTSVMPTATNGSYEFYATYTLGGCESTTPTLVTVNVSDVNVSLTAMDETCTSYADGSFMLNTVDCGVAPFNYSVDGGAFGPIPTDLTAGTYSIVVQDANLDESNPISLTIATQESMVPGAPSVVDSIVFACLNDPSILVEAEAPLTSASLSTTFAAGNGCSNGNMIDVVTNGSPITLTSIDINATATTDINVYYKSGTYIGSEGSAAPWTLLGTYPVTATGVVNVDIDDLMIPANSTYGLYFDYAASYTDGTDSYSNADLTINAGAGFCTAFDGGIAGRIFNGTLYYDAGLPVTFEWFDAASAGTNVGTGSPLETVGTTILPTSATAGSYEFYVASNNNGCYSVDRTLVTVEVTPVNVELTAVDADCNNAPTGSFTVTSVDCGTAPFSFSVDGGAFGPIPTDLTPGIYSIIVQDANLDVSGEYFVEVGDAPEPSDSYMEDITENGGQVSWNANGTETSWNVEYGLPGFTPGTGTEIGSVTASDTFAIITGLDANTNYDVYVSANCGTGTTTGEWDMVNFTTDCGIYTLPFFETFEDNSETRVCWYNINEIGAMDWTYETGNDWGVNVTNAFEGTKNAMFVYAPTYGTPITKLASPRFDFAGQDSVAIIFSYSQEEDLFWGDWNDTKVYSTGPSGVWTELVHYSTPTTGWVTDTLFVADTVTQIAFEGINNYGPANTVDYVQVLPCNLNTGVDGSANVCRLDGTFDLNSVVTLGETFGKWTFAQNQSAITGNILDVTALPTGTFDFYYVVSTPCATDTTVATLTIFPPSSAGVDGTITACANEPINLLSGLSGNIDLGGQWYDPQNNPTDASITASNFPGQYNFDYITSNGVCPSDTSNIVLTVSSTCDYLDIQELVFGDMTVYPNPTDGLVYVTSSGNSEVYDYELTDVSGKVITAKKAAINGTETTEVNIENLEPGVYMIRVYNTTAEKTFRVVKK